MAVGQNQRTRKNDSMLTKTGKPRLGPLNHAQLTKLIESSSKPKDKNKLFWSNSSKHAYENLLNSIQSAHPKFFEHFVPKNNLNKYVLNVHGDLLDQRLKIAEHIGYTFTMMHPTYTETLQKRFLSKGAL